MSRRSIRAALAREQLTLPLTTIISATMECLIRTPRYEALRTAGNSIFIVLPTDPALSDADAALAPAQRQPTRDEQGLVNYYDSADEPIDRLWREKLGRFLYDHVVKEELKQRGIRRACFSIIFPIALTPPPSPIAQRERTRRRSI